MNKYLNLGCGFHFSDKSEWTNIDFTSTHPKVIEHNLLNGIPAKDSVYEMVYHSHVLEHFSESDGKKFIEECYRVLKPGGVIRIVVPDLEQIASNYLKYLNLAWDTKEEDEILKLNYQWMMIEMYDQTVRNFSGGKMLSFLSQENLKNEEFVFGRIGEEGKVIRAEFLNRLKDQPKNKISLKRRVYIFIRPILQFLRSFKNKQKEIGKFRFGGEIHQWMYDRYSLRLLLTEIGFENFQIVNAFHSHEMNWGNYHLDGINNIPRKPDSIYVEAVKPL
jgi:predicted SAM-dependent methyltransferase